ncbi:helix-turn-helix transcriptional regulator [Nitrogeniibacter aestuarii]|uniref:helix-turn-helix transcriptional regulator n=1 Tax=Nitrogeniibacter aestuarii TaxID=2815343 RepID=UPI001D11F4F4|nr:helix-turn-helix domain-containing protein [Nitrogeniibacter aestuarii]
MTAPTEAQLLKKTDVCRRLALSPRCLETMVSSGRFPPGKQIGRYVFWSEKAVSRWIEREFTAQEKWMPDY